MRVFKRIGGLALIAAFTAVGLMAQAQAGKIGVVDTRAFGAKDGITKYIAAEKKLNDEFTGDFAEVKNMETRLQTMKTQIDTMQKNPQVPADYQKKVADYNSLVRQYKYKDEDVKTRFAQRRQVILGPVSADIMKKLQDYTVSQGFTLMFDAAPLDASGLLLGFDSRNNVTKAFVAYYNALPATTAQD
ncbi:MAG: OmpH family outer membrane protein [Pyrinomonadaceae bacterium]|nr:OmpH family outer membrane protein [Pyrinomonadaceae bacterium]